MNDSSSPPVPSASGPSPLVGRQLTIGYGERIIAEALSLAIPPGSITAIVGPNACGKSTLLRTMARLLTPLHGAVLLDGELIDRLPTKQVARRLGLLPQSSTAPDGITVVDLVARGRYPHQTLVRRWTPADEEAVTKAMVTTAITDLADRPVDELSGGQRQRVWLALVLAQDTPLLLLDEPTTFLDIAHQLSVLNVCRRLNREGRTIVAVLHDLNHACRYASHLVALAGGRIVAAGAPAEVVTADLVHDVFGVRCIVIEDPVTRTPLVVPLDEPDPPAAMSEHGERVPAARAPARRPATTAQGSGDAAPEQR